MFWVALLVITAPSVFVLAWLSYQGGVGFMAPFSVSAISLVVLLGPALLERRPAGVEDFVSRLEGTG